MSMTKEIERALVLATQLKVSDRSTNTGNNPFRPPPGGFKPGNLGGWKPGNLGGFKPGNPGGFKPAATVFASTSASVLPIGRIYRTNVNLPDVAEQEIMEERVARDPLAMAGKPFFPKAPAGVNKMAVLKAQKDAEILRLRAELRETKMKLNSSGQLRGGNVLRGIQNKIPMKRGPNSFSLQRGIISFSQRGGGGVVARSQGKHINLRDKNVLDLLGKQKPLNGSGRPGAQRNQGGARNRKSTPCAISRGGLDIELDMYMAKSKTKQKHDLDDELDKYMAEAKPRAIASGRMPAEGPASVKPEYGLTMVTTASTATTVTSTSVAPEVMIPEIDQDTEMLSDNEQ